MGQPVHNSQLHQQPIDPLRILCQKISKLSIRVEKYHLYFFLLSSFIRFLFISNSSFLLHYYLIHLTLPIDLVGGVITFNCHYLVVDEDDPALLAVDGHAHLLLHCVLCNKLDFYLRSISM